MWYEIASFGEISVFYEPKDGHGLPHNPFNAIVAPRPIGWISSKDEQGRANLAPYSFFNAVAYVPPQVMFSSTEAPADRDNTGLRLKDSISNIESTGEFAVNIVTWDLREAMNRSSAPLPKGEDEFQHAGLSKAQGRLISAPLVAEAPIHLECRLTQIVELKSANPQAPNRAVFGEVVGIHICEEVLKDGLVDTASLQPIARMGYKDYAKVTEIFAMTRPD